MNRFAKIMLGIGWMSAGLWIVVGVQGTSVETQGPELSLHTILGLAAGASTILARSWTSLYLLFGAGRFAAPHAMRARKLAWLAALASFVVIALQFALSGKVLWGSVSPVLHATTGAALVAMHVAALLSERRALALESPPLPA